MNSPLDNSRRPNQAQQFGITEESVRDSSSVVPSDNMQDEGVSIERNETGVVSYQVPYRLGAQFPKIFTELDENPESFGIKDYVVRVSTLEEVFIEIGRKEEAQDIRTRQDDLKAGAEVKNEAPVIAGSSWFRKLGSVFNAGMTS